MRRKTFKDWDPDILAGFPVGLFMHPTGANRQARRASREHKHDPMPPSSMVPALKRVVANTKEVEYVASR